MRLHFFHNLVTLSKQKINSVKWNKYERLFYKASWKNTKCRNLNLGIHCDEVNIVSSIILYKII